MGVTTSDSMTIGIAQLVAALIKGNIDPRHLWADAAPDGGLTPAGRFREIAIASMPWALTLCEEVASVGGIATISIEDYLTALAAAGFESNLESQADGLRVAGWSTLDHLYRMEGVEYQLSVPGIGPVRAFYMGAQHDIQVYKVDGWHAPLFRICTMPLGTPQEAPVGPTEQDDYVWFTPACRETTPGRYAGELVVPTTYMDLLNQLRFLMQSPKYMIEGVKSVAVPWIEEAQILTDASEIMEGLHLGPYDGQEAKIKTTATFGPRGFATRTIAEMCFVIGGATDSAPARAIIPDVVIAGPFLAWKERGQDYGSYLANNGLPLDAILFDVDTFTPIQ